MKKTFDIKRFILINIGIVMLGSGLYFFLIPSNLAVGGITGFATVINAIFPQVPVGIVMFISNIFLLFLAFIILDKEFAGYTIYVSLALSVYVYLLGVLFTMTGPLVDDIILNILYGVSIQGIGMAIILNQGTSSGGTDIIAKILEKYTGFSIGNSLILADLLVVLFSIPVFGLYTGMYAFWAMILNSTVIDRFITGINRRIKLVIISEKEEEIKSFIIEELNRGVTILYGAGGFSNEDKRVINTLVSRREYMKIRQYVKEVDPRAFIWVNFVHEVLGEGFSY